MKGVQLLTVPTVSKYSQLHLFPVEQVATCLVKTDVSHTITFKTD